MAPRRGSASPDDQAGAPRPPDTVLMTVTLDDPTPAAAAKQLGVAEDAIDTAFGVVIIDPDRQLYAVRIPAAAAPPARADQPYRGPFADPAIAVPPKKP